MLLLKLTSRLLQVNFQNKLISIGVALIIAIFLLVLANLIFIGYIMYRGKPRMKEDIKLAKQKRKD